MKYWSIVLQNLFEKFYFINVAAGQIHNNHYKLNNIGSFLCRSKYFRGKKVFGDFDIRLEQAEFKEINLSAYSEGGCVVDIHGTRGGSKVAK